MLNKHENKMTPNCNCSFRQTNNIKQHVCNANFENNTLSVSMHIHTAKDEMYQSLLCCFIDSACSNNIKISVNKLSI